MMGKTHRQGGALSALTGYIYLKQAGYIPDDVFGPVVLGLIYPLAMYGTVWPDTDHNAHANPLKDRVGKFSNLLLHPSTWFERRKKVNGKLKPRSQFREKLSDKLDAKHRSKVTHSDATILVILAVLYWVQVLAGFSELNQFVVSLFLVSFGLGIMAHLILDGITHEGIWCITGGLVNKILFNGKKVLPEKLRLVPNRHYFATGGKWEALVNKVLVWASYFCILWIIYDAQPYRITI